jgi:hypothetical protein
MVAGFLLLLVAIIVGSVMAMLFRVQRIDDGFIYLKLKPAALAGFSES